MRQPAPGDTHGKDAAGSRGLHAERKERPAPVCLFVVELRLLRVLQTAKEFTPVFNCIRFGDVERAVLTAHHSRILTQLP